MKKLGLCFLMAVLALPIAAVVTIVMAGFWSWFEAKTGIEALGHSGPADWCYGLTYMVVLFLGLAGLLRRRTKNPR